MACAMRSTQKLLIRSAAMEKILEIKDLQTNFYTDEGIVRGCDHVSYTVHAGETLAVVGESGSGKSVTVQSVMRLIPTPPGRIDGGEILFKGQDLLKLSERQMQAIRGNDIAMIFQEPMTSLNPVMTIGSQIAESLILHEAHMNKAKARQRVIELLTQVGIAAPDSRIDEYPHQLSGGMRQRVMIAMALACNPQLLIADEPTSALDVTIQAQILRLIDDLKRRSNMAVIMITHDLGVVAETADRVAVMYAGKIVEYGPVEAIFDEPKHPYLIGLKRSMPTLKSDGDALYAIPGMVPIPTQLPQGCKFAPRCEQCMKHCETQEPPMTHFNDEHYARCWLYVQEEASA
jgi:peptide/nickel transport system ATP-binding protein/oligopeptide transport system ATP-binding protein